MKRGLKGRHAYPVYYMNLPGSSHCPDEKGTESLYCAAFAVAWHSSSHCPDEKGTESNRRLNVVPARDA